MNRKCIIYSRFNDNDAALNTRYQIPALTKEWIEQRIDIFQNYTRKSFDDQTNQEFIALMRTHPDSLDIVNSVLKDYPKLNDNIIFTSSPKEDIKRYIQGADEFYLSQIDSDDMFHPDFINRLQQLTPKDETSAIICQKGYIYNVYTDQLCYFNNISSAVFTQRFRVNEYMKLYQYMPEISHVRIYQFPYEPFPDHHFMILTHKVNTHTTVNPYLRYEITNNLEKKRILDEFHIKTAV